MKIHTTPHIEFATTNKPIVLNGQHFPSKHRGKLCSSFLDTDDIEVFAEFVNCMLDNLDMAEDGYPDDLHGDGLVAVNDHFLWDFDGYPATFVAGIFAFYHFMSNWVSYNTRIKGIYSPHGIEGEDEDARRAYAALCRACADGRLTSNGSPLNIL